MKAIRRFTVRTALPASLSGLADLALNLRWSWHPPTRALFAGMCPQRWAQCGEDPQKLLAELTPDEIANLAADPHFVAKVAAAQQELTTYLTQDQWYQKECPDGPRSIAYFSPEYGITHVLPQYSGGLGILAGDHLKSASDLGIPLIGVGLNYASGYFKQTLTRDGWQTETYPVSDPDGLPLTLLRETDGTAATISVALPGGRTMLAYIWQAQIGRIPLLLLDSDVQDNDDDIRTITNRLYGGENEHRIQQEMLLGIGGVRALRKYCELTGTSEPTVYHSNEGHAGFLGLERMRELVQTGLTFDEAREAARAGTVFTTHTPVPAGIDRFPTELVSTYLGDSGVLQPLNVNSLLAQGAETYPGGNPGVFNMAIMGLRLAQRANGVSALHGEVSRNMFRGLWAGFDADEVPISAITNGVHAPTWVHPKMIELVENYAGANSAAQGRDWSKISQVPDSDLWQLRRELRQELVHYCRGRINWSWRKRGAADAELGWVDQALDPNILTIGFARRVPTYKRLTLMLRDPKRLKAALLHPERPIQLIIAGKSHPADEQGKRLIQEMVQFADDPVVRHRIAFLPNYDIALAQHLYPGCDVWLNNPLRPQEACGTSGMKSALNGGLNLSILDGWWDECFDGENGWAIPTANGITDPDRRDDLEAAALYDLLDNVVAPHFYDRNEHDIPERWVAMMRHTLSVLGPKVLATRMVKDYTNNLYQPAHTAAQHMLADGYELARDVAAWKVFIRQHWSGVHIDHVESSGLQDSPQVGDTLHVSAYVALGALTPKDVHVEVVYGRAGEGDVLTGIKTTQQLTHVAGYEGGRHRFEGHITLQRTGSFGYTVRVLPQHIGMATPVEMARVVNA